MSKRFISLALAVVMVTSLMPMAKAASSDAIVAADALYELGLFSGTGTDANGNPIYDLDRMPTRFEAAVMLVRLLGKDSDAKTGTWKTPFTDVVDWAAPYVGYAYTNGLIAGTSATTYGGNESMTASQYLTLILRALGYDDSKGDFTWDKAWELSDRIGMTSGQYSSTTKFTRGDVASISYSALKQKSKNADITLIQSLDLCNAVSSGETLAQLLASYGGIAYYKEYPIPRTENINLGAVLKKGTATPHASVWSYDYPFDSEYEAVTTCELYRSLLEKQGFVVRVESVVKETVTYEATAPATGKKFTFYSSEFSPGNWIFHIWVPFEDVTIFEDSYDTSYYLSQSEITLAKGESTTITATIDTTSSTARISWDTVSPEIIRITTIDRKTSNGKTIITARVTALQSGYASISAWWEDDLNPDIMELASCSVYVPVTKVASPVTIINMCGKVDSVGGVRWTFDLRNNTDKTIKYATISWKVINAVGDVVYDDISGRSEVALRITGPIRPADTMRGIQNATKFYTHEYSDYLRLTSIDIEYMDGSSESHSIDELTDYWYQKPVGTFEMALNGYVMLLNLLDDNA